MAKTNQNFQIYKGEVKILAVTIRDKAGTLVDLSSISGALYRVSKAPKATSHFIEKTDADLTIAGLGVYHIPFEHDDTDELKAGTWYHELRIHSGTEVELVVMSGNFQLDDSNTNVVT